MKKTSVDARTARQIIRDHLSKAGAVGGSVTSPAKAQAARENGKKGGRPNPIAMWCGVCDKKTKWSAGTTKRGDAVLRIYTCTGCGNSEDRDMVDISRCR